MPGSNHRHGLGRILPLLAFYFLFLGTGASHAQTPEFIYEGWHVVNNTAEGELTPITSRTDSTPVDGVSESSSASASDGTLTLSTTLTLNRTSGSGGWGWFHRGYGFALWANHPGDIYLSGSGSASYTFNAPSGSSAGATVSYGDYMYNAGSFSATLSNTSTSTSGPSSRSGDSEVHLQCGGAGTTTKTFSGVTYYKVAPSGLYNVLAGASMGGPSPADTSITGNQTITARYADQTPSVVIQPPEYCFATKTAVFYNLSDDPDNPEPSPASGSRNTCTAAWEVTGPNSFGYSSASNDYISFIPPDPGLYTTNLTVWDNEGVSNSGSQNIVCRKITPGKGGTGPTTPGEMKQSCNSGAGNGGSGGSGGPTQSTMPGRLGLANPGRSMSATGSVAPDSGNAAVRVNVSNQATRGSSLPFEISINSQRTIPNETTYMMANGYFTYSIGFRSYSGKLYLYDADGSVFDLGPTSGFAITPPGFMGSFQLMSGGFYKLVGAGPPGEIWQAGDWTYEFNVHGGILGKIIDPNGNQIVLTYNLLVSGYRYLTEVKDLSSGRKLTLQYNSTPRMSSITEDSTGNYTTLGYNSNGWLNTVQRKDSAGNVIEKVDVTYYSTPSAMQELPKEVVKDGDTDSKLSFAYVAQPVPSGGPAAYLASMSWNGGGTSLNYFGAPGSGASYRTESTNSKGGVSKNDYDSEGRLIRTILPTMNGASAGATYTFQYDSNHNLTQVSDGAVTTDFTYNSKGKVTEIDDNNGGVWTFTYATNGIDVLEIEDSLGTLVELVYGSSSLPHLPTSITDGDGNTWTKTYNTYGQVLSVVPPTGSPTGTTTYEYEETSTSPKYGFLKKITNGAGNETQFTSYTGAGEVTEIVQTPESGTNIAFQFAYDGAGRTTRETHPDGKYKDYAYNYRKLASVTDEAGAVTAFDFCAVCGKLTGVDMPLSKSLAWDQDADHRTTTFIDARSKETEYEYGLAGELKKTLYPDDSYILYRYDNYGRLAETEDTRGHKKQYAYDDSGRVEEIDLVPASGSPSAISYAFRADGRVSAVTDEVGTTTYSYTAGRKVSAVEYDWSASGLIHAQTLEYGYNPDGTLHSLEWKDGASSVVSWEYDYDGAGRLTEIVNSFGETTAFAYDGVGKLKTQTNENGTSTTYAYNQDRGWPTQILHKLGSTPFASYDLEYDEGNDKIRNITMVTELDASEVEYAYDALNRLTAESRTGTGAYTRTYVYDLAGNLTDFNGGAFAGHDDSNKIVSLSGGSVSHDADGNITGAGSTGVPSATYHWSARNRLARQQSSSDDLSYAYDAAGKRVLRYPTATSSAKRFYIHSDSLLVGEIETATPSRSYTWGPTGAVSFRMIAAGDSYWYHFGPHAETRHLTDATGTIENTYRYDGYGNLLYSSEAVANPFRYGGSLGYYSDGDAGLLLATHRWYSPSLHRWISRDPIGYSGGSNLYQYASSQPTMRFDPLGLADLVLMNEDDRSFPLCQYMGASTPLEASVCGHGGDAGIENTAILPGPTMLEPEHIDQLLNGIPSCSMAETIRLYSCGMGLPSRRWYLRQLARLQRRPVCAPLLCNYPRWDVGPPRYADSTLWACVDRNGNDIDPIIPYQTW